MVRITFWFRPLSPMAFRAALMRLVSVDSDTIRPLQTEAIRSSLLTTRSRFLRQVSQQIEHLRLDMDDTPGAPQFTPFEIDLTVAEGEDHP
jgi:hypothetical protein